MFHAAQEVSGETTIFEEPSFRLTQRKQSALEKLNVFCSETQEAIGQERCIQIMRNRYLKLLSGKNPTRDKITALLAYGLNPTSYT